MTPTYTVRPPNTRTRNILRLSNSIIPKSWEKTIPYPPISPSPTCPADTTEGLPCPTPQESYDVDGKKYRLYGELNYTKKFSRTASLALGYQQSGAYTGNDYTLSDGGRHFNMHDDTQYLFAEYSTTLQKLGMKLGAGVSRTHFSNEATPYTYWMFRPNLNIQYRFSDDFSISYQYQNEPTIPSLSQLTGFSNVTIFTKPVKATPL